MCSPLPPHSRLFLSLCAGINAAMKNIMVKAEGSKGVKPSDLEPLVEAMEVRGKQCWTA